MLLEELKMSLRTTDRPSPKDSSSTFKKDQWSSILYTTEVQFLAGKYHIRHFTTPAKL